MANLLPLEAQAEDDAEVAPVRREEKEAQVSWV